VKKLIKPYSLLLYLLAFIACFFIGIAYAGLVEAGKGQMLAGGAIVLGYGVIGAVVGFCLALVLASKAERKLILKINGLLAVIVLISFMYFALKYQKRQHDKEQQKIEQPKPQKTTTPAEGPSKPQQLAMFTDTGIGTQTDTDMGLGMFTPNFYENKTLYFYGNITAGKSAQEHMPIDSITFKQREYGGFDIATAPPWLVPDHLKLDYDMLYFKVESISHDFMEVVVNTTNKKTAFVDRSAGKLLYWPEFLLSVHSVEYPDPSKYKVYARPFENSGVIGTSYHFLRPLKIKNEWMYVALLGDDFNTVGNGWIRWQKEGKLLIIYSLLS
tara:strand:+ start:171782 stop:172765 length:984 start_codon:yes stop_codon:yes gene_type:complete